MTKNVMKTGSVRGPIARERSPGEDGSPFLPNSAAMPAVFPNPGGPMSVRVGALLAALLLAACGPSAVGGTSEVTPPVITIGVAPPKAALHAGKSAQFTATVTGSS